MQRIGEDATAFSSRDDSFVINMVSTWTDPKEDDANIKWPNELLPS